MYNQVTMMIRTFLTQQIKWHSMPMIPTMVTDTLDQRRKTKSKKITKSWKSIHKSIMKVLERNLLTLKSKRSKKTPNSPPVTIIQTSITKHKIAMQKRRRSKQLIKNKITGRISSKIMVHLGTMSKVLIKVNDNGARKIKKLIPGFCQG